jgi:hypothetical protein
MFDSVLHPAPATAKRWSASALVAVGAHAVLFAVAILGTPTTERRGPNPAT